MHTHEHVCNPTVPVCSCGAVWEYGVTDAAGVVDHYTSAEVVAKFRHIYGQPHRPNYFVRIESKETV